MLYFFIGYLTFLTHEPMLLRLNFFITATFCQSCLANVIQMIQANLGNLGSNKKNTANCCATKASQAGNKEETPKYHIKT